MKQHRISRILLTVMLLLLAVGLLLPTVLTITNSFMTGEELATHYGAAFDSLDVGGAYIEEHVQLQLWPRQWTLKQFFVVLFQSPEYVLKFWSSVLLVVPIVLGQVLVASMAAYSLSRVRSRLRGVIFFFYVMLMLTPYQVTLVPNYVVSKWLGILGTRWAVIFPGVFAPFSVFLLTRFMRRIPSMQIEAAQLDGAGEWRIFTRICLPQCRGVLYSVMILVFLDYWNMVEQPLVLLEDAAQYPLSIFLSQINTQDVAIAFAAAVVYMIPPMLLFLHGERHLVDGIAQSGSFASSIEQTKRRRWVVVVATLFFAVLGFLALFLQPLTERFVPRVTQKEITGGTLHGTFFDYVVPNSAVQTDDEGAYVLVVYPRESALADRYQVERVPVIILAREGEQTAVDGALGYIDPIVETYSILPKDGEYVQLQEKG